MPFETIETFTKTNMPPTAKISYMRRGSDPDAKPQLVISIPTTVCGVAKAEKFVLMIGTGADLSKIRVRGLSIPGTEGIMPKELKNAFVFRFGYVPKLGDDIFDGERRPVKKITDDEFEITVPFSWFETDQPEPKKDKAA